jgi:hypothetical protein
MTEKRSLLRATPSVALEVYNQLSGELLGYIKNISHKGMKIETLSPLFQGVEITLRVHIPDYPDGRNQFSFTGICIWWIKNPGNGAYNCGIEIKHMTSSDRSLMKSMISDLCV